MWRATCSRARARISNHLKARARTREFQPVILPDTRILHRLRGDAGEGRFEERRWCTAGSKYPDEWVLYTAHWDPLGTAPDAKGGDGIYNGAVDNAAGTAQRCWRSRATSRRPSQTERSLAFLFVTAEEQGLLGSEYYALNPLYPLAKTVANLNTDAPRPLAPAKDFSTAGDAPSTLQDILIEVGRKYGRSFTPESKPEAGYFFRSDHFSLAKRGVPAISFRSGGELKDGDAGAGKARMTPTAPTAITSPRTRSAMTGAPTASPPMASCCIRQAASSPIRIPARMEGRRRVQGHARCLRCRPAVIARLRVP